MLKIGFQINTDLAFKMEYILNTQHYLWTSSFVLSCNAM